jgi:hypothetical protein
MWASQSDNFMQHLHKYMLTLFFCGDQLLPFLHMLNFFHLFLHQIASMFGPAFLLKLYLAGALSGSSVFLADMAFLAPRKQVKFL